MWPHAERLVESLKFLKELQDNGVVGIHTDEMPNRIQEILLRSILSVVLTKGWYIPTDPAEKEGETTSWYSSCGVIVKFLNHKFGDDWCLSADQSLLIHA